MPQFRDYFCPVCSHTLTGTIHLLTLALNGALAARHCAAWRLLALRFGGGDSLNDTQRASESYWEDVCAAMGLLATTLANRTRPLL
jgi:hypothetical protein